MQPGLLSAVDIPDGTEREWGPLTGAVQPEVIGFDLVLHPQGCCQAKRVLGSAECSGALGQCAGLGLTFLLGAGAGAWGHIPGGTAHPIHLENSPVADLSLETEEWGTAVCHAHQ